MALLSHSFVWLFSDLLIGITSPKCRDLVYFATIGLHLIGFTLLFSQRFKIFCFTSREKGVCCTMKSTCRRVVLLCRQKCPRCTYRFHCANGTAIIMMECQLLDSTSTDHLCFSILHNTGDLDYGRVVAGIRELLFASSINNTYMKAYAQSIPLLFCWQ